MPNVKKNSFYRMDLVSGAVALNARLKDMPLAEGDTTYELKGGFNSQVFVMTGNVAKTPSFGAGTLDAGYLRTYVTGLDISGSAELPKLDIYNFQEGIFVTEPDSTAGWSFPSTIGQNVAVYSSQFDSSEVWMGEYFDGADKSVGVVTADSTNANLSLKDCYLDPAEAAAKIFIGGGGFIGRGDGVVTNLMNKFSYRVNGQPRVYVRPNSKSRMKGLWTSQADSRNEKEQWSIYAPFWKWDKIQPLLKYGAVGAQPTAAVEDKDATTNNTIFNHISASGDFGDITSMTSDSPLLESKVEISTTKSKTGGTSLRMYHLWQFSEAANRNIEMSLGDNYVNPQVAKAAIYDIPIPAPLDLGAFDYMVSSSTGPAVTLSGTASWASGSAILTGATVYAWSGSCESGNATVTVSDPGHMTGLVVGRGLEGTGIPSGAIVESYIPSTSFTMNVPANDDTSTSAVTGSTTRWAAGLQDTTIEGVVSGSMIRQGYQNYIVRTIDSHYEMSVDRPLTATTDASVTGASSLTVSGPIGAESGKTIYNIDTDVAKSFTSGAHLTDKRLIFPEIDVTMNITKLQQSPAINPNAVSGYVGRNGRQYYKAGRGYKNSVGSLVERVDLAASDIDLNADDADWEKGGPLTSLLRSVVVTFSSYKSDSFDTLDDFIDYGMNRYYCEQHDAVGVQDQGYGYNIQNDTQLCGIVFQRPFGNAEDGVDEDTGQPTSDESKGHVYAYALPVSKWFAPQAYGATPGSTSRNLNSSTYGNYGLHGAAGMALIDNSATTQIQGNTGSNIGIKNIVVQPKYDGKYWDPDLQGTCSLAEGAATNSQSRQTCEQSYMTVNNDWDFESGSTTVLYPAATMDPDLAVGQIITNHTDGTVIPSGTRITAITGDASITMSQPATKDSDGDILNAWGTWKPDQYTNINGALEPHWVKIPLDEFFTMKFVFDKYAKFGNNGGYGATYSYQDYTTGLPSDYQLYQNGASSEIYGVPIRCYFDGGLSGSTNLGSPIKQGEDTGPTGSNIETLPYINLPMMFSAVNVGQSSQGFTQANDNWRGMVESWPKHMTIWVNNYRYTQYNEGDADETNALFRGAQLKGTKGAEDDWDTGKYIWESAKRRGADSVLYGNAQTAATGETGAADEFYLNPEVEVFIDSIELKYFNHPITNHSIQAGEMQRFINLQNNKILTPVTTNTWNTVQHGAGYSSVVPEGNSAGLRTKKAFNHDGNWTPRNPGLNISIGFKDDPATYFPVTGAGTGNDEGKFNDGSGRVDDIYLLLNNFSTAQFGRIDQIAPSVAWKPVAGAWSEGVAGGISANFAGWLGSEFRGRAWASGCTIGGGTGTDKNRASWAGSGYTGSNGGVSTEYAGWSFYPIETASGEAFDGKFGFGAGENDWLSCDGMTQKGFLRMSQDLTYNDDDDEEGASLLDRWQKTANAAVAAKILGVQGSYQLGQGSEAVINSNTQIFVDSPDIFSEPLDDTYLIYRQDRRGRKYDSDGTANSNADYDKYQLGYKKIVKLALTSEDTTLAEDIIELVVYEADGTTLITDGLLYADDGITKLGISENLGELWISPLRYWVNMSFIDENLDYRRAYESINAINKTPLSTADPSPLGSTYNEWLYSYNVDATGTKGTSGIYEKPWILGAAETSSLVLTTDYGYGTYDDEKGTGGQLGQATAVLNQYCEADISGIIAGGSGGGMGGMGGGGAATSQDLNLLVELSNQSTAKTITLVGDDEATLDSEFLPSLIWQFHDDLPKVAKLVVGPAFDALGEGVNLYELTTENLNSLKFTWEEEGDDIWYRMLMIDTGAIPNKYHKCSFHMPLNEFQASPKEGNKPQIPAYKFYNYVSGSLNLPPTGGNMTNGTAVRTSIEGLAGYAFQGQADDGDRDAGLVPEIAFGTSANQSILLSGMSEYTFVIHGVPATGDAGNYMFTQGDQDGWSSADSFYVKLNADKKVEVTHGAITLIGTSIQLCDGETPLSVIVTFKTGVNQAGRQPLELYVNGALEDYDTTTSTAAVDSGAWGVVGALYNTDPGENTYTWEGLLEEVLIYTKRWAVVPEGGEYIFNSENLVEKTLYTTAGKWQTQNAKMFVFDYHNIRGSASDVVAQSNLVGWKVTTS